jgi:hypothetical protein
VKTDREPELEIVHEGDVIVTMEIIAPPGYVKLVGEGNTCGQEIGCSGGADSVINVEAGRREVNSKQRPSCM